MIIIKKPLLLLFVCALAVGSPSNASDIAKEKRWAEQIVDGLFEGDPHYLEADGHKFLAIYTPAAQPKGAVILLHGIGVHPDWPQVINPLRTQLPGKGWTTLSLQMPILANEAKAEDYAPLFKEVPGRIKAAVAHLEKQGVKPVVIVAHSMGATMANYFLANSGDPAIKAVVGIGMSGSRPASERALDNVVLLEKIRIPVLDVYGSLDLDLVTKSAKERAAASSKGGNPQSRQVRIDGANHFQVGYEAKLLETITAWLAGLQVK